MEMKHTPGPWTFEAEPNGVTFSIWYDDDTQVAESQTKDDAKLIAAAPDLLEACEYVVKWHREHDSGEGELFGLDFVTTCIAAIRKAIE
jgi:hypothetical protein